MANVGLRPFARALGVALALAAGVAEADPPQAWLAARTFQDWRLVCADPSCEIAAVLRGADGSKVLTVSAAGRGAAGALLLRTPLPLFLPDGLTLGVGPAPPRAIAWRTCGPAGCEAVAPLEAELLASLRRERTAEATLTLVDGVRVRLAVSLNGFTAAWEALAATAPVTPP